MLEELRNFVRCNAFACSSARYKLLPKSASFTCATNVTFATDIAIGSFYILWCTYKRVGNTRSLSKPVVSSEIATPAPVAIAQSTLAAERPNYDSPTQGNPQYDHSNGGYIYQKPSYASPSTTTGNPANAIIVLDPPEFISAINNDQISLPPIGTESSEAVAALPAPSQGYDYNAPSTPNLVAADTSFSQPASNYLPSVKDQQYAVDQKSNTNAPLRLRIQEMRCLQHQAKTKGYSRAAFKIDSFLSAIPSVDNDTNDKR
ncbi:hypothetical protein EVAR_71582_1 [Eumeta japonica]|uniref:Uncharacterized protein n=1 Tax=Eumeta variegata TaxID=151549 RepID=A0A4C1SUG3_EUMVA|nr:hypothetical protein EVAR_71582_1 [Eumeta japonica]